MEPACSDHSLYLQQCSISTQSCCRIPGGQVFSFGELLWRDVSIPLSAPELEVSLVGKIMVRVAAGGFHCGALSEQGNVYMWGENTAGQCGVTEQGKVTNITGLCVQLIPQSSCVATLAFICQSGFPA